MARVKVKKQSTFIDMTAMSDVTVLLLTFFMLTSTFIHTGFDPGFRDGDQDTRNRYSPDFGG